MADIRNCFINALVRGGDQQVAISKYGGLQPTVTLPPLPRIGQRSRADRPVAVAVSQVDREEVGSSR